MFTEANNFQKQGASNQEAQASKKATSFIQGASLPKGGNFMTKFQLLFYLKKQKNDNKTGLSPIYLRISCDKRTEISLNKWVHPDKWNPAKQCVSGTVPEAFKRHQTVF